MLLYTASYMPFRIAFIDEKSVNLIILETFIDVMFIVDIIIQFFSAYEDQKVGMETRHSRIAMKYLYTWFLFDVLSW